MTINQRLIIRMSTLLQRFTKSTSKANLPDLRPGDIVQVYQKIPASAKTVTSAKAMADKSADKKEGSKERLQTFEGVIIARKHGREPGATITVRKVVSGIGVERIFPLHSPIIDRIELVQRGKVRRAKLYYLRSAKGKKANVKRKLITNNL